MYFVTGFIFLALAVIFYALMVAEVKSEEPGPVGGKGNPFLKVIGTFREYYRLRRKEGSVGWLPALCLAAAAGAVFSFIRALGW